MGKVGKRGNGVELLKKCGNCGEWVVMGGNGVDLWVMGGKGGEWVGLVGNDWE